MPNKMDVELERCIMRNDLAGVDAALGNGANPNAVMQMGYPMLSWAIVSKASVAVMECLVKAGADAAATSVECSKPSAAELAMAFCRPDAAAYLAELQAFDPAQKALCGVEVAHMYQHGEAEEASKIEQLFRSIETSRAIGEVLGPLEDAFSPVRGGMPRKGMMPM